ncbi:hypothetical protein K6U52_06880 [Vibrio vulnificus]|nr:hypothetical protein [Vibrio vulnificus]
MIFVVKMVCGNLV